MLSNTGSKQRFPCQQFRAPSQPVTLQSASFGYGYTDSLEKLKFFIKVHTRVLKHRQECDRWGQRTSPFPCQIKNSQRNNDGFIIQLVMLVIGVFSGSRVLYAFSHFVLLLWLFQPWEMIYRMPVEQHLCLLQFVCGWWYYLLMFCCIHLCAVDGCRWFLTELDSEILHTYTVYIHL